jgi:hypothetical protein
MPIEDRLLFCGTIRELNRQESGRGSAYAVAGQKLGCEYYGTLARAFYDFKKLLARKGYCGAVEFTCKPALGRLRGYAVTAAPVRKA